MDKRSSGKGLRSASDIIAAVLPVISVALLLILWFVVSRDHPLTFPTPMATWERFLLLLEKPIMRVSYPGPILLSLRRVLIALLFRWVLGISFGVLIGWSQKMNAFFGSIFEVLRPIPPRWPGFR